MSEVKFYRNDEIDEKEIKYSVIVAKHKGKWIYCRHNKRTTFEIPGGHIEEGETSLEAAKRELYEETGAIDFDISPVCVYSVDDYGKLFFAEVKTLGDIPNGSEIAEVTLSELPLNELTYPHIQPYLFHRVQGYLSINTSKDELWDVYDENRNLTGRTQRRGDESKKGDYHLGVDVWIRNDEGEFLIQKRSPNKGYPNLWECQGGSAVKGDDSLTAAVREAKEECGITLNPQDGKLIKSFKGSDVIKDVWLFNYNFDMSEVVYQEGETSGAKKASYEEIMRMYNRGEFIPIRYLEELSSLI